MTPFFYHFFSLYLYTMGMMIIQILILVGIIILWTLDKWVLLYRVIRRKRYKRSLTKRERKLNKTYNKIRNDRNGYY